MVLSREGYSSRHLSEDTRGISHSAERTVALSPLSRCTGPGGWRGTEEEYGIEGGRTGSVSG